MSLHDQSGTQRHEIATNRHSISVQQHLGAEDWLQHASCCSHTWACVWACLQAFRTLMPIWQCLQTAPEWCKLLNAKDQLLQVQIKCSA